MKKIFIVLCLFLFGLCGYAQRIDVVPLSVSENNAYGFENISQIVAKEVVSADGNFAIASVRQNLKLKNFMPDKNKPINLKLLKNTSKNDTTLVIMSYVADKNNKLFDAWDILKISTDFDFVFPNPIEVKAILTDNNDGVILWQNTYIIPSDNFKARNMLEATEKREKITSYSRNIIAPDITQNINMRLNPKIIDYSKRIQNTQGTTNGIGLKYKNNAPVVKITPADDKSFEERWRNDDSFSY